MRLSFLFAVVVLGLTIYPTHAQTRQPAPAADPLAIGETFTIRSKQLGETRRINVYAPAAYSASPDVKLP